MPSALTVRNSFDLTFLVGKETRSSRPSQTACNLLEACSTGASQDCCLKSGTTLLEIWSKNPRKRSVHPLCSTAIACLTNPPQEGLTCCVNSDGPALRRDGIPPTLHHLVTHRTAGGDGPLSKLASMLRSPERFHFKVSARLTHVALSVKGKPSTPGISLESHVTVWHFNQLSYVRHLCNY
jgi:hypothetical protein